MMGNAGIEMLGRNGEIVNLRVGRSNMRFLDLQKRDATVKRRIDWIESHLIPYHWVTDT